MRRLWIAVNIALIGISIWTGYSEMEPEKLRQANPDAIFCTIVFVTMILLSLGSVWYSISVAKQTILRRPSWRRFSIDWWHDPLQCLLGSCCVTGAMAAGAAFRLSGTSATGFWMFSFFVAMFVGLLTGQLAVYAVYREHIGEA